MKFQPQSVLFLCVSCAAVLLSGCAALIEAPIRDKAASFEEVQMPKRDLETLTAWLQVNTAFAFADASGIRIIQHDGSTNDYIVQIMGERRSIAGGLAAAISKDGYYITAAHVLEQNKPVLLVRSEDGELLHEHARVVWSGGPGHDLALLKAEPRRTCLTLAVKPPVRGEVVLAAGATGGDSAGLVLGTDLNRILHTAPLRRGDSGGPLINRYGALIGVNRAIHIDPIHGRRNEAAIVNPEEIIRLIKRDRRQHMNRERL